MLDLDQCDINSKVLVDDDLKIVMSRNHIITYQKPMGIYQVCCYSHLNTDTDEWAGQSLREKIISDL